MVDDDHDPNTYTMIDNNVINIIMMMSAIHWALDARHDEPNLW